MSRSSTFTTLNGSRRPTAMILSGLLAGLAAVGLAVPDRALGQLGGGGGLGGQFGTRATAAQQIKIKAPLAHQVFQRDANGRATIPIELDESVKDARIVDASAMFGRTLRPSSDNGIAGGREVRRRQARRRARRRPVHDRPDHQEGSADHHRGGRAGLRGRPLGAGRAVEHAGRGRPARRHAAEQPGAWRWGWTASGARPRSRCTGWSIRPTRSTRAIPKTAPSGRPRSTRRGPRGPAWACRSPWRWSSRRGCRSAW